MNSEVLLMSYRSMKNNLAKAKTYQYPHKLTLQEVMRPPNSCPKQKSGLLVKFRFPQYNSQHNHSPHSSFSKVHIMVPTP